MPDPRLNRQMNPNPLPPKFTGVSDNDDVLYGMRTCFPDVAEADRKSRTCAGMLSQTFMLTRRSTRHGYTSISASEQSRICRCDNFIPYPLTSRVPGPY